MLIQCSMAPIIYSVKGGKVLEQLWKETLKEFEFVSPEDILHAARAEG